MSDTDDRGSQLPPGGADDGGYVVPYQSQDASDGAELRAAVGMLRRHILLVLAAGIVGLAIATYQVRQEVPLYRAEAVVRLVDSRRALTSGIGGAALEGSGGLASDPLLSQIQVLQSRSLASEVVERTAMRLRSLTRGFDHGSLDQVALVASAAPDTLRVQFRSNDYIVRSSAGSARATYGAAIELEGVHFGVPARPTVEAATLVLTTPDAAVAGLLDGLRARPRDRTDVVDIEYTDPDRHLARKVVNEAVTVFQEQSALTARQQSMRRRQFVEEQLTQTDSLLADAQLALVAFRSGQEVFSPSEQIAAQQSSLLSLDVRREEILADRGMYGSLLQSLENATRAESRTALDALASAPGISSNSVVSSLYRQLLTYETELESMTTGVTRQAPTHPDVLRLNELIGSTKGRLVDAVRSHITLQDARIEALDGLRERGGTSIEGLPQLQAEEARLVQHVASLSQVAEQLREEHQRARIAEAVESGQVEVVDLATAPAAPLPSEGTRKLLFGLILGLMAGSGGAYVLERMNTSINRTDELDGVLHVPGLAVIPRFTKQRASVAALPRILHLPDASRRKDAAGAGSRGLKPTPDPDLVTVLDRHSAGAEAYRTLRTNLIFGRTVETLKSLAVTSAMTEEGKTTTAANLAVAFAQQGMRVLLADCDLRRPRLEAIFGVPRSPGITDLLGQRNTAQEAIHATAITGLSVLPCGTIPTNPGELLGGRRMKLLLQTLSTHYDMLIVDTPPLLAAADASIVGTMVDGVLLVVRAGSTDRAAVVQAVNQLAGVGATVIGSVLNDPDASSPRYGGYYYGQYYGGSPDRRVSPAD